ncbi:hypothetical protein [Kitasatospora sp. NPDC057015]|uniref:hypothetical protein n=1 Tax=Kitasatospora sp. NPDC057015 TaxID=3346001 RepID=UPI00363E662D
MNKKAIALALGVLMGTLTVAPVAQASTGVGTRGCTSGKHFEASNPRERQWAATANRFYNYNGSNGTMTQTVTSRTQAVATTSFSQDIGVEVGVAFSYINAKFSYGQGRSWSQSTWVGADNSTTVTIPARRGVYSDYGTWGKDFDAKSWQRICIGNTPYDTNVRYSTVWVPSNVTGWYIHY